MCVVTGKKAYDSGIGRTPFAFENILYLRAPDPVLVRNGNIRLHGNEVSSLLSLIMNRIFTRYFTLF